MNRCAMLLMFNFTFFLVHSSAFFFVFSRALLIIVLCADTLIACSALLHINSVANLFHLGCAVFILYSATLLLMRGTALLLIRHHRLILGVAVLRHVLGHVPGIHGKGQQNCCQASK